ncbi:MAG TPA: ABC transporter permease [Ramlibacter sp.]|uniref:ABC transporter permease n=1 Tax=Ramlibacter sp. TaxID=1917967 RepID=UPI002CBA1A1E|nr:ABC transporter permease [Ramlibacter sp.]HVZ44253.1 ABC transporter permease [Ramlibacter sp.]
MSRFLATRAIALAFVMWLVTIIAFTLIRMAPGDPSATMLGSDATPQAVAEFRAAYGLDRPIAVQYLAWLGHVVRGDLGTSIYLGRPVTAAILERLPASLTLTFAAFAIALFFGVVLGLAAAYWRDSWVDRLVSALAALSLSIPSFWLGICLIYLLSVRWPVLPSGGFVEPWVDPWRSLRTLVLPSLALGYLQLGLIARMTRASMLEALRGDYVRVARAKGVSEFRVVVHHAFGNSLIPLLTVAGVSLGVLFGGAVVIETVFTIPGVGRLLVNAVVRRDYPVVQGTLLIVAAWYVLVNLVVDFLYTVSDPRVRLQG